MADKFRSENDDTKKLLTRCLIMMLRPAVSQILKNMKAIIL